jgi:hypothetical protein
MEPLTSCNDEGQLQSRKFETVFVYHLGVIMKPQYHEGPEALKKFEDGMKKLFQAPKPAKSPFKPPAKPKPTSKD